MLKNRKIRMLMALFFAGVLCVQMAAGASAAVVSGQWSQDGRLYYGTLHYHTPNIRNQRFQSHINNEEGTAYHKVGEETRLFTKEYTFSMEASEYLPSFGDGLDLLLDRAGLAERREVPVREYASVVIPAEAEVGFYRYGLRFPGYSVSISVDEITCDLDGNLLRENVSYRSSNYVPEKQAYIPTYLR